MNLPPPQPLPAPVVRQMAPPQPWPMCPVCGWRVARQVVNVTTTLSARRVRRHRLTTAAFTGGLSLLTPRRRRRETVGRWSTAHTVCGHCGSPW